MNKFLIIFIIINVLSPQVSHVYSILYDLMIIDKAYIHQSKVEITLGLSGFSRDGKSWQDSQVLNLPR